MTVQMRSYLDDDDSGAEWLVQWNRDGFACWSRRPDEPQYIYSNHFGSLDACLEWIGPHEAVRIFPAR